MSTQVTSPPTLKPGPGRLHYSLAQVALAQSDLTAIGQYMFWLMFRNVSSDGLVFESPPDPGNQPSPPVQSLPGCILASPSWEDTGGHVNQDYVFNWTRDAAIAAIELAAGPLATSQPLAEYVHFAQACQNSASAIGHFDRASFLINGTPRDWTDQTDGPALQTLAILQLFSQLDAPAQAVASAVIAANLNFLEGVYQGETWNLWEEEQGASFFTRSVQLKCLQAIAANTLGIGVPGWLSTAIPWLQNALAGHWNGQYYQSLLPVPSDSRAPYDPNIDIVAAAIYGAVPVTDTKLLATAALLRSQWADPSSPNYYAINGADQQLAAGPVGPLLGRYPGDTYDGDTADQPTRDHPWAVSTAIFAELYYQLAQQVNSSGTVPLDSLSATFFSQIGVTASTTPTDAVASLQTHGDQMLMALVYHSDHFELSEQFDAWTGYEKSVSNLSWSYASFLSAVRAKNAIIRQPDARPADRSVMTPLDISAAARPLTIAESEYLLQTCERVVSLLALDETWSVYLTAAAQESRVAEVDFSGLLGLSEHMLDGLGKLGEAAPRAADSLSSQSDQALMAGLQRLRDQYGPAELFDWLLDDESARTSLREVFLSAWNWIGDNVADERDILQGKREILSTGNLCDPDFRLRFKCILVVAGIGAATALAAAGVVATLGIGATVGLGVVATAGATALAWKDSGCGGEVRPALG